MIINLLPTAPELMQKYNFTADCISLTISSEAYNYFLSQKGDEKQALMLSSEVARLQQQVLKYTNERSSAAEYLNLLYGLSQELAVLSDEAELLEVLIPYWQKERGVTIASEKPVDEFYSEFEMVTLWSLIALSIKNKSFSSTSIIRMRAIIRRYSNMPTFWLYLYEISGEEVKASYTF